MDDFSKEFLMELFLDNDSVSTTNRLAISVANVINENNDNIRMFSDILKKESKILLQRNTKRTCSIAPAPRIMTDFYENTVLNFTDDEYISRFKMKRNTVQELVNTLRDSDKPTSCTWQLTKKVHVFLWLLTNDSSYSEVGNLFNLHKSSVSYIFKEISSLLIDKRYQFICWPSVEEQHATLVKVNSCYKFPNCVGFIDACYFKVGPKRKRKRKPNIVLLQAVCNECLMFIDIHVGEVGNEHKGKVFRQSSLSKELEHFVSFENHILGDSQYKLRKNLITPFTTEELLTDEEMRFNEIHWNARSYISLAFELLKERFTKLNHIDICKSETIETLIIAACILHNFVLLHEGYPDIKEESVVCDDGVIIDTNIVRTASEKRQFLCNYVNYIDNA